jgi:hypothetical protein
MIQFEENRKKSNIAFVAAVKADVQRKLSASGGEQQ